MLIASSGVSRNFFIDSNPENIGKDWADFVLIDTNPQNDRSAYSVGSASIYLYAKPTGAYSRKNVKKLDSMEALLDNAIAAANDPHYVVQINWRDSGYDSELNFHFNIVNISIIVK